MGKLGLKNMKIGTQIILTTFLIVIITIVGLFSSSAYYFADYVDKSLRQSVSYGMIGIKNFIETEMLKVQQFRDHISENELLAGYVASGDTQALHALIAPLMRASGIDIVLVADTSGKVIARPHTPDRIGDDQSGDETVQMSLRGETWERLMSAPSSKLGYYCGTPIRAEDGQIVGMLRTARSFDNEILVDTIKKLYGFEVTLFAGSTRFNTTVMADGKRAVGTEAPERITRDVLEGGQDVVDPVQILGQDYYGAYSPIIDKSTGKTMGMYFCGEPAQDATKANSAMRMSVAAVSVVVFIIAAIISIFTARGISKPLKRIVALSERSRDGDLTITKEDYKYNGGGELGTLVEAMSEMIAAQQKALYQVVLTAGEVESNAAALSGLSGENASAMSDSETLINKVSGLCDANAQAIERSVSNVAEMSTGANSVAQMSVSSAESISKTTRMSKLAADSVNGLVGDIGRVDAKTAENQDKIRILSSSVAEISNFMGVIGSIADQTNLLALNAAIEAARAGEAGRGFAVVAEEVRKLAEESRNASKSVEELVALLSRNADEAISASEQSVIIVKEIMSKADATVEGLNSAISEITRANEAIQSIAAVAQEQAASSSEISRAIEDISSGTEEITSTLGELTRLSGKATGIGESVADSAQRMARGAQDLQGVLKLFRIN